MMECPFVFYNPAIERETRFHRIEVLDIQGEQVGGKYEEISWFGVCS
jgi:hypothetical protein